MICLDAAVCHGYSVLGLSSRPQAHDPFQLQICVYQLQAPAVESLQNRTAHPSQSPFSFRTPTGRRHPNTALPRSLNNLTVREAIADTLYRYIIGLDTANATLFDSAFTVDALLTSKAK